MGSNIPIIGFYNTLLMFTTAQTLTKYNGEVQNSIENLLMDEGLQISEDVLKIFGDHHSVSRSKRAYWGFDKFVNHAVEATNHFGRIRKRINKYIDEQNLATSDDDDDYYTEYSSQSKLVASQDGYGHKKKKKKKKRKKVVEICSNSNSGSSSRS